MSLSIRSAGLAGMAVAGMAVAGIVAALPTIALAAGLHAQASFPARGKAPAAAQAEGAREAAGAFRRFALVVGTNDGGARRVKLRYAQTDAAAFAGVLAELGGVRSQDLLVLKGADRAGFLEALEDMRKRIAEAAGSSARLELLVYYSGHSDETGLLLGEEKLRYDEFRKRIDAVPAKIRLAVVDACASGALTRLKGGKRLPAFAVDQSSSLSGYAFLTSSSGHEAAQESDRIRASFFTHYLVTGLRGAADLNLDGKVTLGEAYEFAFHETLSQTEGSQAGAQHPSYDMRLTGTGDLVLTDLRGTSAGMVLDRQLQGRLYVRSSSGALVAELQKHAGRKVELGLEPGLYDLRLDQGDAFYRSLFKVDTLTHHPVALANFEPAPRERNRERGDSHPAGEDSAAASAPAPALDAWIPARAAFTPSLGFPGGGNRLFSHNLSLNLLAGDAREIRGLQLSLLSNTSRERMEGLQLAIAFNNAYGSSQGLQVAAIGNFSHGSHTGVQLGYLVNTADSMAGLQAGCFNNTLEGTGAQLGLINSATRERGLQAGLVNGAGFHSGTQAGFLNAAGTGRGMQAGLINVAGEWTGLQVGLVNIAPRSHGAVLGLLNIIGNGLHDVDVTLDEKSMLRSAILLGGPYNYTWYSFDMKARHPRHLWGGSMGLGLHLPRKPFFLDADLGAGFLDNQEDWENYSITGRLRALMGYQPMRYFSVYAGLTYNVEAWPASQYPNLNPGSAGKPMGSDLRAERWTGFTLGVRL